MIHFVKDSKGLKLVVDQYSLKVGKMYEALLNHAQVPFSIVGTQRGLELKVDPQHVKMVEGLIHDWQQAFDDLRANLYLA